MSTTAVNEMFTKCDLYSKGAKYDGAEDGISKDAVEDVPLAVDLPCIDLIKELHEDECVKDDGVMLRWRSMERSITAIIDIKYLLT